MSILYKRIYFIWVLSFFTLTASLVFSSPLPNIVVVMADDMGIGDSSAYQFFTGNKNQDQIHTPAMEKLARMGVLFTDAHTPSTRCTPTRYSLLTGRYPWRSRMKHWVLFGAQGDPLIERDRPTLATMLQSKGYATAVVGKWHVGLRYRTSSGLPAAGWGDADLGQPLIDCPLDHGFDYSFITSRSHGTSGPNAENKSKKNYNNGRKQNVGPGHIHGRYAIAASGNGKKLIDRGFKSYELSKLGSRHVSHALGYISNHISDSKISDSPFFLYYAFNSNHTPYTPDTEIMGTRVKGASTNKLGEPMGIRSDYIYENDVALGKLISYLQETEDPRNPGKELIQNTVIVFTSDNGAEKNFKYATGPFRSNKGSCYEGGHRVPFIFSWPDGGVGNGDPSSPGVSSGALIGHQDLFATLSSIVEHQIPNLKIHSKGAEDSQSFLDSLTKNKAARSFLFVNDHKESKKDPAALVLRYDNPIINGKVHTGQWKILFDASLIRNGDANAIELYNLSDDQMEERNLINILDYSPLIKYLSEFAQKARQYGSERLMSLDYSPVAEIDFRSPSTAAQIERQNSDKIRLVIDGVEVRISGWSPQSPSQVTKKMRSGKSGLYFGSLERDQSIRDGEFIQVQFNKDTVVHSISLTAGNGSCGGYYKVGGHSPLAVYCLDSDNDSRDQSGVLSDIGYLSAGTVLKISSESHWGVESPGDWVISKLLFSTVK